MKMIDYKKMFIRNQNSLREGNFRPEILATNFGWQNRILSQRDFDNFFKTALARCVEIPKKFKHII
jgi:hypothetical protein